MAEKSQIVRIESQMPGHDEPVQFYALIEEVHRRSRRNSIHEAYDGTDGDATDDGPFEPEGVTYGAVRILQAEPRLLTPPIEHSRVFLGGEDEAAVAYGFNTMNRKLAIGRLRNGGDTFAGPAYLDMDYLLGENGGHLNVNGIPGVATKTTFLLLVLAALLHRAQNPEDDGDQALHLVPIILNVKGQDMMHIHKRNVKYKPAQHDEAWAAIGVPPEPFTNATFFAPTEPGQPGVPTTPGCTAYGWALRDVLEQELLSYLFADDDVNDLMRGVIHTLVDFLTEPDGHTLRTGGPQTWRDLLNQLDTITLPGNHHAGSVAAVFRRLRNALYGGAGVFLLDQQQGNPLRVSRSATSAPQVVDINGLPAALQRFVVAAISKQVVEDRVRADAPPGVRYVLVLDELNRFAPRGSRDPITRLLERIATELRSQGILLFGAQQFASEVSTKVVESAAVRSVGRTGPAEMSDRVWKAWDTNARRQAGSLTIEEKLVTQPTFRAPMLVETPFPVWASRHEEVAPEPASNFDPDI